MARGSRILLALVLAAGAGACARGGAGASSPEALIEKLSTALDDLDAAGVASCFNPETPQGARVAELCSKAVTVLKRGRDLEAAIHGKYGESYVAEHVALPGPALLLRDFRSQLAKASLVREDGDDVRLVVDGATAARMYAHGGTWYVQLVAMPFAGFEAMRIQAIQILNRLADHVETALALVESAGSEQEFRAKMTELGYKTRNECAQVLATLINTMRSKGLLRN